MRMMRVLGQFAGGERIRVNNGGRSCAPAVAPRSKPSSARKSSLPPAPSRVHHGGLTGSQVLRLQGWPARTLREIRTCINSKRSDNGGWRHAVAHPHAAYRNHSVVFSSRPRTDLSLRSVKAYTVSLLQSRSKCLRNKGTQLTVAAPWKIPALSIISKSSAVAGKRGSLYYSSLSVRYEQLHTYLDSEVMCRYQERQVQVSCHVCAGGRVAQWKLSSLVVRAHLRTSSPKNCLAA